MKSEFETEVEIKNYTENRMHIRKSAFLGKLAIVSFCLFFGIFMLVWYVDPFYHYHAPFWPFKTVIQRGEYQGIGSIRNYSYDSILLGSSVAENYNNRWFDDAFHCKVVKGIKSAGTTADLLYLWEEALKKNHNQLSYCFYSLDLSALMADPDVNFTEYLSASLPLYLYDENPFNDVEYIFNVDVIFEAIPTAVYKAFDASVDEGETFSWYQGKTFSETAARTNADVVLEDKSLTPYPVEDIVEIVNQNLSNLERQIELHPDTTFYFFFPPYSSLYWENVSREGKLPQYEYAYTQAISRLSTYANAKSNALNEQYSYTNVRIYSFKDASQITNNLDNYMDEIHFSPEINAWIVEELAKEDSVYRVY